MGGKESDCTLKDMELCSLSFNLADEKQRFSSDTFSFAILYVM
jgi:hypothetical protein